MSKNFRISFICSESQLVTIISVLTKEIRGLTVAEADTPPQRRSNGSFLPAARLPNRDSFSPENTKVGRLCLEVLGHKAIASPEDFKPVMVSNGLSANSYSPALSHLK